VLATVRGNGGGQPGDGFGYALKNVGDRNGDGWEELAVGAPFAGTSVGRVEVISFATTPGQSGTYSGVPLRLINGPAATSSTVGSRFGSALETLHTNLGTPLPELLLIGAPLGQTAQGPAQVGTVTAFALAGSAAPVWTVSDGLTLDKFGASISAAGDLNLDGAQDFLVGAPGADYGGNNEAGTVAIYQGNVSPSGVSLPPTLRFVADNASPDENLGISVHNLLRQSPNNGAILDTAVAGGPMIAGATPGFTRAYQNVARPSVQRQLGAGCPRAGSILDLELTITGATIGNTLTFQVRNAVPGQPVFLWGMYPPQSTYQLLLNGRGCFAYLDPTMVESSIVGVADAQGNFTHSQTIINSPMVIGATAHFQAFQVAPSPNGFSFHQVTSSNGVAVTAGGL
ncbi:MAG: hypothetical protein RL417_1458, partial [Pseudomonadota bacterium]